VMTESEQKGDKWKSVKELNDEMGPLKLAPNFSEEYTSTDNRGVLFTGCLFWETDEGASIFDNFEKGEAWEDMSVEKIIAKCGALYQNEYDLDETHPYSDGSFWPCVVLPSNNASKNDGNA